MHHLVAALNGGEHLIPFAFNVSAVRVYFGLQTGLGQHTLTPAISLETDTPTPIGIKHRSAITRIITFQSYCPSIVRFVPTAGGSLRQRDRVGWPRVLPRWCSGAPAEAPGGAGSVGSATCLGG